MKDYEYQKTLMIGALIGAAFVLLGVAMYNPRVQVKEEPQQGKFEILSKYQECEIIKWENSVLSNYQFFMRCPK